MVIADLKNKILKVLGFSGTVQDQEFKFFKSEGVSSKTYPEAFMEWLSGLGFGSGSLQDRLKAYLSFLGFTGAIQDAEEKALTNGIFYDTIPLRVKSILSKYNATLLLPGPAGTVSYWFQPNNYRESTGQTLAAIDQQVGLVVDAAQSPGPELRSGFVAQITGSAAPATYNTTTGSGTCNRVDVSNQSSIRLPGLLVGGRYAVSVTNIGTSGISVRTAAGAVTLFSVAAGATAALTVIPQSVGDIVIQGETNGTSCAFVVNSVRELPGIHASQATSGFQPYLRQVPKTLGPELVVNGAFDSGIAGWINASSTGGDISWNSSSAALNVTNTSGTARARQSVTVTTGAKYVITLTTSARVGSSLYLGSAEGTTDLYAGATVVGQQSIVVTAPTSTLSVTIAEFAIGTTTVDNISIREVLEWTYAWQFDGTDDRLSLSAVPFQTQNVSFAITAFNPSASDATLRRLWEIGGNGSEIALGIVNNGVQFLCKGDTGSQAVILAGGFGTAGASRVASVVITAARTALRIDGIERGSSTTAIAPSTANAATLGNRAAGDRALSVFEHLQIFGKGAISDSELLTLEKFAAKLQGRSL